MMQKKVPLVSMDLYLHRKHGVVSGVIHDMRTGRWACITCLDQLFLYLDDVLNDMSSDRDDRDRERRRPELGEKSESFARIPSNDVKKLELSGIVKEDTSADLIWFFQENEDEMERNKTAWKNHWCSGACDASDMSGFVERGICRIDCLCCPDSCFFRCHAFYSDCYYRCGCTGCRWDEKIGCIGLKGVSLKIRDM